jgi:hypothetical protein
MLIHIYLDRTIDPDDYQRTRRATGYLEPERAFLTRSKEGRRHSPKGQLQRILPQLERPNKISKYLRFHDW